jgi:putative chitobiose transport system substrate-binding protein
VIVPRRWVAWALLACVWAPPGCGSDEADPPVRLEFWTLALRPAFTEYVEGVVAAFEAENPGVEVVWVDVPFDALDRKLIAAAAAGRAPDVVNFSDMTFARFVALGGLVDLRPLAPGDAESKYLEGALAIGRMRGGLMAFPWYLSTQVLTANEALLAEGGLSVETLGRDWATLAGQARAFRERTGLFLFSQPLGVESQLLMMLLADGRPPFREGPRGEVLADVSREDVAEFVEFWVGLYREGVLPREAATRGFDHLVDMYQSGRIAVVNVGPTKLGSIRDAAPSVYATTAVLPPVTGRLGRAHIATMVLGVTTQSEHPALAAELAWFVTSEANQEAFCRLATILPSTPGALEADIFEPPSEAVIDSPEGAVALARSRTAEGLRNAVAFTPALDTWPDLRRAFEDGIKRALLDGADVRSTLGQIEREWERILAAAAPAPFDAIPTPGPVAARARAGGE